MIENGSRLLLPVSERDKIQYVTYTLALDSLLGRSMSRLPAGKDQYLSVMWSQAGNIDHDSETLPA